MTDTKRVIISIGRQFGSGGRVIGRKLAERLGVAYYDKELLALFAKESGFDQKFFAQADEKHSVVEGALQWLSESFSSAVGAENFMSNDSLFKVQSEVIQLLAEQRSCVIVGRCSDYILRNNPHCLSVFLHADIDDRVARVMARMNLTAEQARSLIEAEDKRRANYYNYYSNKIWGRASTYDLCLNVSLLGEDAVVDVLADVVRRKIF